MRRREALLAGQENRAPRRLSESDFLLGVHDTQRMGGLRFQDEEAGPFLSNENAVAAPPWTSLRELEAVSWRYQRDETGAGEAGAEPAADEDLSWLGLLLAPGSSLGGARPKAGVLDPDGDLWIAKFPGRSDERDMGAWEYLTWMLAREAGIHVPEAKLLELGQGHRTFATKRFDRVPGTRGSGRIHYASAMTLLGRNDGNRGKHGTDDTPASYLDIAEFISTHGASPSEDLPELWSRIVFSILVSNTDDHLRNHGFLLTDSGWRLAPAFDINPDPHGRGLHLNVTEDDNRLDPEIALGVAAHFRVKDGEQHLRRLQQVIRSWEQKAQRIGLPRRDLEVLRSCFSSPSP